MAIPFLIGAGLVTSGLSSLFGAGKGIQALNQSKKINPKRYSYEEAVSMGGESPYAKQMLGMAQMQLNARNPNAEAQRRAILGSQANAMGSVSRAVTDPSQALAMTAALQGNTDQAIFNQGLQDQQLFQQRLGNLFGAQQTMIREGDKLYEDKLNKFMMDQQRKDALQQAGSQSLLNAGSNLASTMFSAYGATKGLMPTGNNNALNALALQGGFKRLAAPAMSKNITSQDYGANPFG